MVTPVSTHGPLAAAGKLTPQVPLIISILTLLKALTVPLYAPVAWWFVYHPAGWLFVLSPTAWAARASWAPTTAQSAAFTAGCLLSSGLIAALLRHRFAT